MSKSSQSSTISPITMVMIPQEEWQSLNDKLDRLAQMIKNRNITERHGLTIAEDSLSLDTSKLRGAEKSRIEIRQIGHEVLKDKSITDLKTFHDRMKERGVKVKPLWDSKLSDNPNLKTFLYERDGYSFVGSKIGKNYTPKGLATILKANIENVKASTVKAAPTTPTPAVAPHSKAPAITLSTPSLGSQSADDTNMVLGGGLSDDFAHFLKMHPGLSIEEAKRKFKEQKRRCPDSHLLRCLVFDVHLTTFE